MSSGTPIDKHTGNSETTSSGLLIAVLSSPIVLGGLLAFGFYRIVPQLPIRSELLALFNHYFCNHPLEYATTILFFMATATLLTKSLRFAREFNVFSELSLDEARITAEPDVSIRSRQIESQVAELPERSQKTALVKRIRNVCNYVRGRGDTSELEEHLKYEAELAADELHSSFAFVRTIVWAVPILGFLGTVIGITVAIAGVTPEQLESSLSEVTGGLAVAFDTTALALILSLVLVFASFVVERTEQRVLSNVEEFGIRRLAALLPGNGSNQSPLLQAERDAGQQLLKQTESLVQWQAQLWKDSMESLRERWEQTLETQQTEINNAFQDGVASTLNDHASQLASFRNEFIGGYRSVSESLAHALDQMHHNQTQHEDAIAQRLNEQWKQVRGDVLVLRDDLRSQASDFAGSLSNDFNNWNQQIASCSQAMTDQLDELRRQGEILLKVVDQEEELAHLQQRLTENLQTIQAVETFEETLHNLSAAVHLLTARARSKAA